MQFEDKHNSEGDETDIQRKDIKGPRPIREFELGVRSMLHAYGAFEAVAAKPDIIAIAR